MRGSCSSVPRAAAARGPRSSHSASPAEARPSAQELDSCAGYILGRFRGTGRQGIGECSMFRLHQRHFLVYQTRPRIGPPVDFRRTAKGALQCRWGLRGGWPWRWHCYRWRERGRTSRHWQICNYKGWPRRMWWWRICRHAQNWISYPHCSNDLPKISPGNGLAAQI